MKNPSRTDENDILDDRTESETEAPTRFAVPYVRLLTHANTEVILPVAVACHCEVIYGLLNGLYVAESLRGDDNSSSSPAVSEIDVIIKVEGGDEFSCLATASSLPTLPAAHGVPQQPLCVPLRCLSLDTMGRIGEFCVLKELHAAIQRRNRRTMGQARAPTCEVGPDTSAQSPGDSAVTTQTDPALSADSQVLQDLQPGLRADQIRAVALLLGSDFLQC